MNNRTQSRVFSAAVFLLCFGTRALLLQGDPMKSDSIRYEINGKVVSESDFNHFVEQLKDIPKSHTSSKGVDGKGHPAGVVRYEGTDSQGQVWGIQKWVGTDGSVNSISQRQAFSPIDADAARRIGRLTQLEPVPVAVEPKLGAPLPKDMGPSEYQAMTSSVSFSPPAISSSTT